MDYFEGVPTIVVSDEKGGYVMDAGATDIDRLLDKSRKLADSQKGGDQE